MPDRALPRGLAVVLLLTVAAQPAAAVTVIPDEEAVRLDGGRTLAALVGDVGGDGVRELVRLVPWEVNSGQQAAEVVSVEGGSVVAHGQELVRRAATPEDPRIGRPPSADNPPPLGTNEPARLVAWRQGGTERVLLASIGTVGLPRPCCLTLWEVGLDGGRTSLRFLQDTVLSAASLLAADLDGDGTDELVVVETPDIGTALQWRRVVVLRWNGTDFDRLFGTAEGSVSSGPLVSLGDTDGLPGGEVGFLEDPRFDFWPTLYRIRLDQRQRVAVEHGVLPADGDLAVLRGVDGDRLALVGADATSLLDWQAGEPKPEIAASSPRGGRLLAAMGEGTEAVLLIERGGGIDVIGEDLRSRQGIASGNVAAVFVATGPAPYHGPLRGGGWDGGDDAYLYHGRLISPQPTDGRPTTPGFLLVNNVAALPGMAAVGLFGPQNRWAAVTRPGGIFGRAAGGSMVVTAGTDGGAAWVVMADMLLSPEEDGGLIEPRIRGGVPDPLRSLPTLVTGGRLTAAVQAPAGTLVAVTQRIERVEMDISSMVGPAGSLEMVLAQGVVDGTILDVDLVAITPAGHGYSAHWQVRVVKREPRLEVEVPHFPLAFDVRITGRTDPGATLTIDGQAYTVTGDGSFRVVVPGGLVPRTVAVTATDLLGNSVERTLSVVAPIDYRELPWVPITATLTVLAAAIFYLRAPRARGGGATARDARAASGAGMLEELEELDPGPE